MESDAELLASLESKIQIIRDRVRGVAERYSNGFYLWGEGGTSKSYSVEQTLQVLNTPYKLTNSRVTGKGLFSLLRDFPDTVHVLEDAETLLGDKNAFGVLRSALWGPVGSNGQQERVVAWQTGALRDEFVFTGGIIVIANCGMEELPQIRAIKSRISAVQFEPTNAEVAALMKRIARLGHMHGPHSLDPTACLEVAEAIIDRSARLKRNLDLRLLVNTYNDRLQFENDAAKTHWLDLLDSRMKERAVVSGLGVRAARKNSELALLRQIVHLPAPERVAAWAKATGKSPAALYRRMAELGPADSHFSQLTASGEQRISSDHAVRRETVIGGPALEAGGPTNPGV